MKFCWFEYNLLPLHHRALLIDTKSFLHSYSYEGMNYILYSCQDYYVEVCMDNVTDSLVSITAFKDQSNLEAYLDTMVLEELMG